MFQIVNTAYQKIDARNVILITFSINHYHANLDKKICLLIPKIVLSLPLDTAISANMDMSSMSPMMNVFQKFLLYLDVKLDLLFKCVNYAKKI